ncbi:MAG: hypothetical protein P8X90_02055 [Desulfobacterales bacterium]|jgi:hypothetical protein
MRMTHIFSDKAEVKLNQSLKAKGGGKRGRCFIFFAAMLAAAAFSASPPASAAEARYNSPKVKGYALDYCQSWGQKCGRPAADAYCRSKGYRRALRYRVKQNAPPTKVISDGRVCNAPGCDRIDWVACEADGVFKNPKVKGYALDVCRQWGQDCGKPAADTFCQSRGYKGSVDFAVRPDAPPTRVISTGQICNKPFCDRIVLVTCKGGGGGGGGGKKDDAGDAMPVPEEEEAFVIFDE